jgi:magnesium-transporting ATPase (P-type)
MQRADAAEWILSLATSPERAASIAGDLAEEAPSHGTLWFWGSLTRTVASLVWRAFTEAPLRITGMASLSLLLFFGWMLAAMMGIVIVHMILVVTTGWGSLDTYVGAESNPSSDWLWLLESMAAFLIASFLFGRWLAKRMPQRELAVYAVVWFISHIIGVPMVLLFTGGTQYMPGLRDLLMEIPATVGGTLFTLAGVRRVRRRMPPPAIAS